MQLLDKIRDAFAAVNEAEAAFNEAAKTERAELVSRSKALGLLLLEAKKRHPKTEDFKTFLKNVKGLGLSRAYDLMRLAGGRATDEQLRHEARNRQRKSRANRKRLPPPDPISVTVTESAEISVDQRRADMAALDTSADERTDKASARALAEFTVACRTWLPKITVEADRQKARGLVTELTTTRAEAA
jgi:hypothetical protein